MQKQQIFLQDPTSFYVYNLTIDRKPRRIILIGEVHDLAECKPQFYDKKTTFLTLAEFIGQYHESIGKNKVLDIFSESFYIGGKKLGWLPTLHYLLYMTTHLDDARALSYIRNRLDVCSPKYNFSYYECPEKMRVHLCDVRFIKQMDYSLKKANPQECSVDMLFKIGISYIYPDRIPKVSGMFCKLVSFVRDFLFRKRSEVFHTRMSEYIIRETKIYKQIEHIPSRRIRETLNKWSHSSYDEFITNARKNFLQFEKLYGKEIHTCREYDYVSDHVVKAFSTMVSLPILYVISVYMDMYLTGRLLRTFADDTYARDSVVYVGEFHAKQYHRLMDRLGAKKVFASTSIHNKQYTSCVNISRFYHKYMKPPQKNTS